MRMKPGKPYCSQGDLFREAFADLCNPCGIAEKWDELSATFPSGLHQNKDADGNACQAPAASDFVTLLSVQYRDTQWLWLEVDMSDTGNTLTQVGAGSDKAPAYYKVAVQSAMLPTYWLLGPDSTFGISPSTPYRIMMGVKYPDCSVYEPSGK